MDGATSNVAVPILTVLYVKWDHKGNEDIFKLNIK
jgi:hypothetical protein